MQNLKNKTDVIVIGSGAAALCLAISLSDSFRVAIFTKEGLTSGSSPYAQGGIAAVINREEDSLESHIDDTLTAGAGLCDVQAVRFAINNGQQAIDWLVDKGVEFSLQEGQHCYHLTREGGHSHRRVMHVADKTGAAIIKSLTEQVTGNSNIVYYTDHTVLDLIIEEDQCLGIRVLNNDQQQILHYFAQATVIATGGASGIYKHTTSSYRACGDGIAMAWRAGCRITNMEFHQFHPTCFYNPQHSPFLISEALRGEGAKLLLPSGKQFMQNHHPSQELAPRDIVTRSIDYEMKKNRLSYVLLDISHKGKDSLMHHFPTIFNHCLAHNVDISAQAIPVVPAAHYTCGGIATDLTGTTDIPGLYAIGEAACTGLHGANRMASNSLLECIVFACSASRTIHQKIQLNQHYRPCMIEKKHINVMPDPGEINTLTQQLQSIMWQDAGIIRSNKSLADARIKINRLHQNFLRLTHNTYPNINSTELHNLLNVAAITVDCASQRQESRGLHYNADYPDTLTHAENTCAKKPS